MNTPKTIKELSESYPKFSKRFGTEAIREEPQAMINLMANVCRWADDQNYNHCSGAKSPAALVEAYALVLYAADMDFIDGVAEEAREQQELKRQGSPAFDEDFMMRLRVIWERLCVLLPSLNPNAVEG
tara:strand:- start:769 stop:1152 length:384 start_codon:yes stop_codon:yes gene_type:complete